MPWLAVGTLLEVLMLWLSMMDAVGSAWRPVLVRIKPLRR